MQKCYFPLPEASGCYLSITAALGLSALLEEDTGMEQPLGNRELPPRCDALIAPKKSKSYEDISPEVTSLRDG